ncbi:MAG: mechanosensitive ion channel [Candidatus Bathyarchaeia archaeon]
MNRSMVAVLVTVALVATAVYLLEGEPHLLEPGPMRSAVVVSVALAGVFVFYMLTSRALRATILMAKGTEGDVKMLIGLWRIFVAFAAALLLVSYYSQGLLAAAFGAFGGLIIGWSLQAPISGMAAWILVTLKRPFKVGDRVMLPSYGLVGDVTDVNPMYTVLNQVGGAIGSEEPVGRNILVPNAMLFGNLVINYTPRREDEPIPTQAAAQQPGAYILDEVVTRITFDSDWDEAERILLDAAREVTADIIKATGQEPYIRSDMYDYGVWLRLRYMTLATDRPRITHEITKRIFKEFAQNDKLDFAIPYVYSYKKAVQAGPLSMPVGMNSRSQPLEPISTQLEQGGLILCSKCGTANPLRGEYCLKCGKKLHAVRAD